MNTRLYVVTKLLQGRGTDEESIALMIDFAEKVIVACGDDPNAHYDAVKEEEVSVDRYANRMMKG